VKEVAEIIKAVIEVLKSPKLSLTVFIASAAWLLRPTRQFFPIHGAVADSAALIASVSFTLSGVYLVITASVWLYERAKERRNSPQRLLRQAIARSTPLEKGVLEAIIGKGSFLIDLDAGSPIAMHLQEIKLIKRATGLPYTTYQLATGLADLCISEPALFRATEHEQETVIAELERWQRDGLHGRFFRQLRQSGREVGRWR
jgi:hypothetical protein